MSNSQAEDFDETEMTSAEFERSFAEASPAVQQPRLSGRFEISDPDSAVRFDRSSPNVVGFTLSETKISFDSTVVRVQRSAEARGAAVAIK